MSMCYRTTISILNSYLKEDEKKDESVPERQLEILTEKSRTEEKATENESETSESESELGDNLEGSNNKDGGRMKIKHKATNAAVKKDKKDISPMSERGRSSESIGEMIKIKGNNNRVADHTMRNHMERKTPSIIRKVTTAGPAVKLVKKVIPQISESGRSSEGKGVMDADNGNQSNPPCRPVVVVDDQTIRKSSTKRKTPITIRSVSDDDIAVDLSCDEILPSAMYERVFKRPRLEDLLD